MNTPVLLAERERARLAKLSFVAQKKTGGVWAGDRRSARRGTSLEFADYRNYAPGDDLRRLDWNLFARLQRPYLKLYEDEEDLSLHILLDASASMNWPITMEMDTTNGNKWAYARQLAAALGYIALQNSDRLSLSVVSGSGWQEFGPYRDRKRSVALLDFLLSMTAKGTLDWGSSLRRFALRRGRAGLLLIISDLLNPLGHRAGLADLLAKGYEISVLQVLSPDELQPQMSGELRLLDIESGAAREVSLDATLRQSYERVVRDWLATIRSDCHARGIRYQLATTERPWQSVVEHDLRRSRLLK